MMKKHLVLVLGLVFLTSVSVLSIFANDKDDKKSCVKCVEELPFYFPPGVLVENKNQAKQFRENLRYYRAMTNKYQKNNSGKTIAGDSIERLTDINSTSKPGHPGKMKLVLDDFVLLPDGKIRVTNYNDQVLITPEQLEVVIKDLLKTTDEAADILFQYYSDRQERIITIVAQNFDIPRDDFVKDLDQPVDGSKVTFREMNQIPPSLKKSDFVPLELHFGVTPNYEGVLGLTYLNSGLVYYNPSARVLDYLIGRPTVLVHEMIHVNHWLQSYPLAGYFDPELLAMVPSGLLEESTLTLFRHHYFDEMRELCWIYFGFNFEEAQKRVVKFDLAGVIQIDEDEYNHYSDMVKKMQAELRKFMRVATDDFYSEPAFWYGFNRKMGNDNAWLWLMFAKYYEPVILGGHEKTMLQLQADKSKRNQFAKSAWDKSGKKSSSFDEQGMPQEVIELYHKMFTENERQYLENYYKDHPKEFEALTKMSLIEARKTVNEIIKRKRGG